MAIVDSGNRTTFNSGAVRDMHEGKGRCDLLPLEEVISVFQNHNTRSESPTDCLWSISAFVNTHNPDYLSRAFVQFADEHKAFVDIPTAVLEVSIHFEEGCKKYGERNWMKGIPLHSFVDSAIRHYLKYLRGDTDERHDRAFLWNILCAMWTVRNKPELDDLPRAEEGKQE